MDTKQLTLVKLNKWKKYTRKNQVDLTRKNLTVEKQKLWLQFLRRVLCWCKVSNSTLKCST